MSYEQLLEVKRQHAEIRREKELGRPVACPYDGTPYEDGPRGELHCRFCGRVDSGTSFDRL